MNDDGARRTLHLREGNALVATLHRQAFAVVMRGRVSAAVRHRMRESHLLGEEQRGDQQDQSDWLVHGDHHTKRVAQLLPRTQLCVPPDGGGRGTSSRKPLPQGARRNRMALGDEAIGDTDRLSICV